MRNILLRTMICCIAALPAGTGVVSRAEGAEISVAPAVIIGEEYNDNIYLDPDRTVTDYITHVIPSLSAQYAAPIWKWRADYAYDYQDYLKNSHADEGIQKLLLKSTLRIVQDLLFLDVQDDAGRTSISAVRDYTRDSPTMNQTDYNAFELNLYAVARLTSRTTLTTGYEYRNVWYEDPLAADRTVHSLYGDLSRKITERTDLNASVRHDRNEVASDHRARMNSLLGSRYEYQDGSFLWGRFGPSRTAYEDGRTETRLAWDAGITHRMPSATLSYETGRSWIEDPYQKERREDRYVGAVRSEKERTEAGLSIAVRDFGTDRYVDERKYTTAVYFSHFLMERLRAKYTLTVDRYESYPASAADTMTIVYQTDARLDYHVNESLTYSIGYRYTDSYSADIYLDNYENTRIVAEINKRF